MNRSKKNRGCWRSPVQSHKVLSDRLLVVH